VSVDWSVEEVASELERLLNLVNPQRWCTVTVVEWWSVEIKRRELLEPEKEYGGHFWLQVMDRDTGRVVGSCLLKETEAIEHSEILGIRVFPDGFESPLDS
jgi:RimJ/RimL family protein N-acetyltransferase